MVTVVSFLQHGQRFVMSSDWTNRACGTCLDIDLAVRSQVPLKLGELGVGSI